MMEDQPGRAAVVLERANKVLLMKEQLTELTEQVALLMTSQECQQPIVRCFYCNQPNTINVSVKHITPSSDSSQTVVITVVRLGI